MLFRTYTGRCLEYYSVFSECFFFEEPNGNAVGGGVKKGEATLAANQSRAQKGVVLSFSFLSPLFDDGGGERRRRGKRRARKYSLFLFPLAR